MATKNLHIVSNPTGDGKWSLLREGVDRSIKVFQTQREAIDHARKFVDRKDSTELFIHRADGMIQEKRSYGQGSAFTRKG